MDISLIYSTYRIRIIIKEKKLLDPSIDVVPDQFSSLFLIKVTEQTR